MVQTVSAINTFLDFLLLGVGVMCFFVIGKRLIKLLPREKGKGWLKYYFIIFFSALLITAGIFLCLDLIITGIAKNLILASDGLLPGITDEEFSFFFPSFDTVAAEAFLFSLYIPIMRGCMLGFGVLYVLLETLYYSTQKASDSNTKHYLLISRFLRIDERRKLNFVKAICFCIVLFIIIPGVLTWIVFLNSSTMPTFLLDGLNFAYFMTFPTEIIVSIYLSYFTLTYALNKLGFREKVKGSETIAFKLKFEEKEHSKAMKIIAVFFIILVVYKFIYMWVIVFNFVPENIYRNSQLLGSLFNLFIPGDNVLRIIPVILILFPIEIVLFLMLQISFFFKRFFRSQLNKDDTKEPKHIFFICFIIAGYAARYAFIFKAYYPWLYVSEFMDVAAFDEIILQSQLFYPKLMIGIVCDFLFLLILIFQYKKVKHIGNHIES